MRSARASNSSRVEAAEPSISAVRDVGHFHFQQIFERIRQELVGTSVVDPPHDPIPVVQPRVFGREVQGDKRGVSPMGQRVGKPWCCASAIQFQIELPGTTSTARVANKRTQHRRISSLVERA